MHMGGMGAVKLSILLLYLRIFSTGPRLRYTVYAVMFFVAGYVVAGELSFIFSCKPISAIVHPTPQAKCFGWGAHLLSQVSLNLVSDFIIILVPVPSVWSLQLRPRQKFGILGIFAVGLVYEESSDPASHAPEVDGDQGMCHQHRAAD